MDDADLIFRIANIIVLPGWVALLLAPIRRARAIPIARAFAALAAGLYVVLLLRGVATGPGLPEGAGFSTLAGVEALLSTRAAILGGWVHFLAFDLFVASWIVEDAPRAGVPHWLVVPVLALTLMAGPAGLLLYLLLAAGYRIQRRR
ncbi:MAG: ABA4-like family protein [Sphingomonadaceae bacterium]